MRFVLNDVSNKLASTLKNKQISELDGLTYEVIKQEFGKYSVSWQSDKKLRVVPSTDPLRIVQSNNIEAEGIGCVNLTFDVPSRVYFHIFENAQKIAVSSNRCITFDGVRNFRDLGGYKGEGGRPTRWGTLYRSGELSKFSSINEALWLSLNVDLIIDFRSLHERTRNPTNVPKERQPAVSSLEIQAGNITKVIRELKEGKHSASRIRSLMLDINRNFVLEQTSVFQNFFALLASKQQGVIFHCSAGKDRTGFAAALLLTALGVSQEQIMQDYLLTRQFFIPEQFYKHDFSEHFAAQVSLEQIRPLLEVHPDYLNTAFDTINKEYGSVDNYLTQALGVTSAMRKTLQNHYLQK